MKRIAVISLALVALYFGYKRLTGDSPDATYVRFAEEMLQRHYDKAAALSQGLSADDLAKLGTQERIGPGPAMFSVLFASRFNVDSRETAADGSTVLHATQIVLFNPNGIESAVPAMKAVMKQVVTLRKSEGAWKVTAFENAFESMGSFR
ncbi:MAG TPA: hypothetical protein VJ901_19845 [Thermoanaerobaculia bacterium]|nr:hypothetical protein [Thermoanaerobaculia bacterium]